MLIALGAAALGMGARGLMGRWLGDAVPFVFALPAVFAVGWWVGMIPASITPIVSVLWPLMPWVGPTLSPEEGWRPIFYFMPSALLLGFFASRWRDAMSRDGAAQTLEQRSGVAWLRSVMLLAGLLPLAMFAVAAASLYHQVLNEAELRVERAARIGEEHALKIFETNVVLMNRVLDSLDDQTDDSLLSREAQLHEQLKRMSANLPQLQGIFVIGASGRMIVNNRTFPAPHNVDFSDRPAFGHHREGLPQPFISEVLTSRTTGEPFFDMSLRRTRGDGTFGGIVSTSMLPGYFAAFYRQIADEASNLSITLRRADGVLLAGWPETPVVADKGVARTSAAAASELRPGAIHGATPAVTRQLQNYPVFVSVRMERSAVLAPWYNQIVLLLALTFPTASGLMYIIWVALHRTREALQAADALREEMRIRKQAEESLRQSQKMEAVGQLTGGIAHDFNNLLQIISANLQLIRRAVGEGPALKRLSQAQDAVTRGAKLSHQLLAFGRRQPLEPKVVNVGKLLLGVEDMVRRSIGEAIEFEAIVSGGLWNTYVDPNQIENVILNLAINARDAMQGAGKLTMEVANAALDETYVSEYADLQPGQYVMLAVSDTGAGMSPEVIARAFEPFFTTKPPGSGTGLGLSMVYGFVKQSNGHVKIYSEVGHGTTIKLYLPRSRSGEDEMPTEDLQPETGGSETILVVEDDAGVREATVEMLKALGYIVLSANDADSAIRLIDEGTHVDLLFTDVVMPGVLRSPELARLAREKVPGLAVLFTSGYTQNAIVHGGRLDAGTELLAKPYTAESLARRVRAILDGRGMRSRTNATEPI